MKKVTRYEADDGAAFGTEQECIDYERSTSFKIWYHLDNGLCDLEGNLLLSSAGLMQRWLIEHKEYLSEMLRIK